MKADACHLANGREVRCLSKHHVGRLGPSAAYELTVRFVNDGIRPSAFGPRSSHC